MLYSTYSRQVLLPEIGKEGQALLQKKKVAVVGVGALGTVASELLARSGIKSLVLVDRDVVEESNLSRQILYTPKDLDKSKALAAQERLKEIAPSLIINSHALHLNNKNIFLLQESDLILDCTDNLHTRFLLNDFCRKEKIPLMYGAAIRTEGYVMPLLPGGPCLRCFLKEAALETCATVGVLNTITVMVAAQQVTQALKILMEKEVDPRLWHYDAWKGEGKLLSVKKNPSCPACQGIFSYLDQKDPVKAVHFCGSGRYQVTGKPPSPELRKRWEKIDHVEEEEGILHFKNIALFPDGRALIRAASESEALALYAKWVGN